MWKNKKLGIAADLLWILLLSVFAFYVNRDIVIKGLYMDDLYMWSCYGEQSLAEFVFPIGTSTRFRPVYWLATYLQMAIDESRKCIPSKSSYCVGAVILTRDGKLFTGYTHESSPTHHAEQEAIFKALRQGADLRGATIFSSMEPCSSRKSEPESCSEMIIRYDFRRVVFALYEPDCFVRCQGALNLRSRGIEVNVIDSLAEQVREINAHIGR